MLFKGSIRELMHDHKSLFVSGIIQLAFKLTQPKKFDNFHIAAPEG